MSLLKANSVQIGQSTTGTNNFTLSVPSSPDGTIKLARGNSGATTADILSINASGVITGSTFSGATINSSTVNGGTIASATAQASTSGTAIDFTGIPSWVKRLTVMFSGISTNSASLPIIQLGTSAGVKVSDYIGKTYDSGSGVVSYSSGFTLASDNADGNILYGTVTITLLASNAFTTTGLLSRSDANNQYRMAGGVTLSSTLDRIRITTVNGTDTFDAGSINIMYEG